MHFRLIINILCHLLTMGRPEADLKGGFGGGGTPPRTWGGLGGARVRPPELDFNFKVHVLDILTSPPTYSA